MFSKPEKQNILILREPETAPFPVLVDSPHSGRVYPKDFYYSCSLETLQQTEDNHLELFLSELPSKGITTLEAQFPRCYLDVNRAATDIDPALLSEPWQGEISPSIRSEAGIGLVRRLVRPGIPLYSRDLSVAEVQHRIDEYYHPYHDILDQHLNHLHYHFGQVWYLNMHSMPSSTAHTRSGHPVDFVIGDLNGTTCRRDFVHALKQYMEHIGYRVSLNDPYKGVELISRHSNPSKARHAIQIEINKALYWDERNAHLLNTASQLHTDLNKIFDFCLDFIEKELVLRAAD